MNVCIRVTFGNGACSGRVALGAAYELRKAYNIDALIGLPCSVGQFAPYPPAATFENYIIIYYKIVH